LNLPVGSQRLTVGVRDAAGNETRMELTYQVSGAALSLVNYPNPVKSGNPLRLKYVLDQGASEGKIMVFDAAGEVVYFNELQSNQLAPGFEHLVEWDGKDLMGNPLPRGVYFALLSVETAEGTQKARHKIAVR